MSPELLKAYQSNETEPTYNAEKSDVFSLGIVFLQIATLA
jgi:hypothetical protein